MTTTRSVACASFALLLLATSGFAQGTPQQQNAELDLHGKLRLPRQISRSQVFLFTKTFSTPAWPDQIQRGAAKYP